MSENIARYNVILEMTTRSDEAQKEMNRVGKNTSGLQKTFARTKALFASLFVGGSVALATKQIFDVTAKYEKYNTVLKVATGSQQEASATLALIEEAAKSTVFSVDELTASMIKFINRGVKVTKEEIANIADLAASQGKSFDQLTEAILDAQTGEFERLKEFGIRASSEGNKVTLAFRGMTQTIEKTPKAINDAIVAMGALNGIAGANREQMSTLNGILSNLGDTFDQIFKAIGDRVGPAISSVLSGFSSLIGIVNDFISIPLEQKLRNEQSELNLLVAQITEANISQDERNKLIGKLQAEYPNFLKNLDAEKVSNEQLALRLQDANNQYILRIALAKQQEKLDKAAEGLADAQLSQAEKNKKNTQILIDLNNKYRLGLDFTNKTLAERQELVRNALNNLRENGVNIGIDNALVGGVDVFDRVENRVKKFQNTFDLVRSETELIKKELEDLLKIGDFTGANSETKATTDSTNNSKETEAERKKRLAEAKKRADERARAEAEAIRKAFEANQELIELNFALRENDARRQITTAENLAKTLEQIEIEKNIALLINQRNYSKESSAEFVKLSNQIIELESKYTKLFQSPPSVKLPSIYQDLSEAIETGLLFFNEQERLIREKNALQTITNEKELQDELTKIELEGEIKRLEILKQFTDETTNEYLAIEVKLLELQNRLKSLGSSGTTAPQNIFDSFLTNLLGIDGEKLEQFKSAVTEAVQFARQATLQSISSEISLTDQQLALQEKRVQSAIANAEKGKSEQLAIEEERLNELQKKREDFVEAQRALATLEITAANAVAAAKSIEAISKAFSAGPVGNIPLGIATTVALGAQIATIVFALKSQFSDLPAFNTGIERFRGKGTRKSDSNIARLSIDERVVDAATNEEIGFDFPNKKLPDAVKLYKMFPRLARRLQDGILVANPNINSTDSNMLYRKVDQLTVSVDQMTETISNMRMIVKLDQDGFVASQQRLVQKQNRMKTLRM